MLAEHLHNASVRRKMIVPRQSFGDPGTIGDFQSILPTVRVVLVRTEEPEILCVDVQLHHIAQESSHNAGGLFRDCTRSWHGDSVIAEVREAQIAKDRTTIGVWISAHPTVSLGGELGNFGKE